MAIASWSFLHKFELVVNLWTSEALDIKIPRTMIQRTKQLIGYTLVVSYDVWAELSNKQDFEELGAHKIQGRSAVAMYGYTGSRTEVDNGEKTWIGMLGSRQ